MTLRPDVEALVQGALDDTLTPEERETLDRLMTESVEVRGRLAHLQELTRLLESLGPAEPPARLVPDVLAEISRNAGSSLAPGADGSTNRVAGFRKRTTTPQRPVAFGRRFTVSRKILFGLAAAAVLVLSFATFRGYPPATEGTEAAIGGAGEASARSALQAGTWDAIVKDQPLRTLLQDANARSVLQDAALQQALTNAEILEALRDPAFSRRLSDAGLIGRLNDAASSEKLENTPGQMAAGNLDVALRNEAFVRALRNDGFRRQLTDPAVAAALAGPALQQALEDPGFSAALGQARSW
jgi:hypothetical protein